jgi:sulfite reductase beta subunit-like hemoprotein
MTTLASATDLGRARTSFANEAEIDEFVELLGRFERGEMSADAWRTFRLTRGIYGQRQPDTQMVRVKIPQGLLDGSQLLALADIAETYSRGFGHITTRQNVQFHFVAMADVEDVMRRLADAGLTTREACGSAVRNITACPYAGVSDDEVFDVTPYAEALTRYLLRHPLSASLPRKFKIAFEGCISEDHAFTGINDIGFRAAIDASGRKGFLVTAGGGTSTMPKAGRVLFDFLPADEILEVAEAIIRVFHAFGDYQHKQRNRMKFLIKTLGWDEWHRRVLGARAEFISEGRPRFPFDPDDPPEEGPPARDTAPRIPAAFPVLDEGALAWLRTNVRAQRQREYAIATITLPLGDVTADQLRHAARIAAAYGDGVVRATTSQNLVLRWVRRDRLVPLYHELETAGLSLAGAGTAADVVSCPGAETCKIAVTQSRGLGRLLEGALREQPALTAALGRADIKISGCPNGCGQHHVATIGFQGSVRKVGGRAIPQYFVMIGGGGLGDATTFGRLVAKVPARRIPDVVSRLAALYARDRDRDESASSFFARLDVVAAGAALADLAEFTAEDAQPDDYIDLGEDHPYTPEVMEGECAV